MPIYTFTEQFQKQKAMFDAFVQWLQSRGNVVAVTMADNEDEKLGIDMWATVMGHSNAVPIQVKVDFRIAETHNLAVEMVSEMRYDGDWKPGWFSQLANTKLLVYIDGTSGHYRIYKSQEFFRHIVSRYNGYDSFVAKNGSPDGGDYWYGMGVRVPAYGLRDILIKKGLVTDSAGELQLERS